MHVATKTSALAGDRPTLSFQPPEELLDAMREPELEVRWEDVPESDGAGSGRRLLAARIREMAPVEIELSLDEDRESLVDLEPAGVPRPLRLGRVLLVLSLLCVLGCVVAMLHPEARARAMDLWTAVTRGR